MSIAARRMLRGRSGAGGDPFPSLPSQRGALAIGTASYSVPGGALYVDPVNGLNTNSGSVGAPLATVAKASQLVAAGGTIVCRGGTYHETFTHSGNACTVINYPGETVWFDGSVVVTSWTQSGSTWVHSGVPTQFNHATVYGWSSSNPGMLLGDPYAAYSDQVFYDGQLLTQIADAATPAAGQFSVDYTANTITIGNNPAGHEVRVSDLRSLVVATQPISWKGVGVRRYAPDNTGSISAPFYYGGGSGGSTLENVVVRQSAMSGGNFNKPNITVRFCTFENNMHSGLGGNYCDGLVVDSCLVQNNNVGQFKMQPTTGGIKITNTIGLTITNCLVKDNVNAAGIWTDMGVIRLSVTHNVVTGPHRGGISIEASDGGFVGGVQYRSVVAGNYISGAHDSLSPVACSFTDYFNNTIVGTTNCQIWMVQDRPVNDGSNRLTYQESPEDTINNVLANNILDSSNVVPLRVLDAHYPRSAHDMNNIVKNNMIGRPTGGLVQWGTATPGQYVTYNDFASFHAAEPVLASGNVRTTTVDHTMALGLPANVATALGLPAGTKHMGSWVTS